MVVPSRKTGFHFRHRGQHAGAAHLYHDAQQLGGGFVEPLRPFVGHGVGGHIGLQAEALAGVLSLTLMTQPSIS
jgi:hypothetical protein